MEKFEQFFKENRLRIDTEDLDNDVWRSIENSFKEKKTKILFRKIYIAASIIIISGLSAVIALDNDETEKTELQSSIFNGVYPELAKEEEDYIRLVNAQIQIIKEQEVGVENVGLFNEFIQQLEVIDKQYELYKKEIQNSGYNDELIQQIIYNYQLKLSVLQMLRAEIEKINNRTNSRKNGKNKIKLNI